MKKAAFLTVIISAWWLAACGGEHQARKEKTLPSVAVETVAAEKAEWPAVYEAIGSVSARTTSTLSAKVMAYVIEIKADAGDRVRTGQLLVVLDSRDLDAGVRLAKAAKAEARSAVAEVEGAIVGAKARVELAESTFKRMEDLHAKKSITEQEFDEASAKLRMAKANYEMAAAKKPQLTEKIQQAEEAVQAATIMRSYATIKAPFDGIVTRKMADTGMLAAPGAPLLAIEKSGSYWLEASVEESRLPFVKVGQEVEVRLDALTESLQARVTEIVPSVDVASRAFVARIELPRVAGLRSGVFGRARFEAAPERVLSIPVASVVTRGQVKSVFVVEDGRARGRLITVGKIHGDRVAVLSGLRAGERIVSPANASLLDGSPVEVRP